MDIQDTLSHKEIIASDFQFKRKRIGHLYNSLMRKINAPRKKAIRQMLNNINPNLSKMLNGVTIINI